MNTAAWTAVAAVATSMAAVVTAWMAWTTRRMAAVAEEQVSVARTALEGGQRPVVVTTARTARITSADSTPIISQRGDTFIVPVQNIGPGAALNVSGVGFWRLYGENGEYDVTTSICMSPHPVQLAPGATAELEFEPLVPEPIRAPNFQLRLWYGSASGENYWTAEHLASYVQGYQSQTGRWPMPTDVDEDGAIPDGYTEYLAKARRDALAKRFGGTTTDES